MNSGAGGAGYVNLSNQRVSFVNKIGLILKATSDDETVTPGYLYKEINAISFESVGYSESLVEFLVDRLKKNSSHVKLKVLKLIKHLLDNGSKEFRLGVRRYSAVIQECTKFGGSPHPIHGNAHYLMIRKIATEVCEYLYNMAPESMKSYRDTGTVERQPGSNYGGLGPARPGGSSQGFGNTPSNQSTGFGEAILGGLEKLGAKMTETPSDRQAALLANLNMSESSTNYQPPSLPPMLGTKVSSLAEGGCSDSSAFMSSVKKAPNLDRRPAKKPTPGKAGGGWCDEDEDSDDDVCKPEAVDYDKTSNFDKEILTNPKCRQATNNENEVMVDDRPHAECSEENNLLASMLASGCTGPNQNLLSPSQISAFVSQASKLCCTRLVEILAQNLTDSSLGVTMRALQLLEGLVYHDEELVNVDVMVSICREALVTCFLKSQADAQTSNLSSHCQNQEGKNSRQDSIAGQYNTEGNETSTPVDTHPDSVDKQDTASASNMLVNAVCAKSAKLILILQQLSSFKELLPVNSFTQFLSTGSNFQKQTVLT